MANLFIIAITIQYFIAAVIYVYQQQFGSALMFFSYSLANLGFLYQTGAFK